MMEGTMDGMRQRNLKRPAVFRGFRLGFLLYSYLFSLPCEETLFLYLDARTKQTDRQTATQAWERGFFHSSSNTCWIYPCFWPGRQSLFGLL
jgi:hypothetical protein